MCLKIVRIVIINKLMFKFINFSLKFIIIFFGILIFFVFSTLWYFSIGLPDYKKLSNYQPPISSRVYSKNNKLIAEYALEKRLFIPYESIPEKVVNSFLLLSNHVPGKTNQHRPQQCNSSLENESL